jgi:hypothetical protein
MLKRIENVQAYYQRDLVGLVSGNYRIGIQIGRKEHLTATRVDRDTWQQMKTESQQTPIRYAKIGERTYWRYQDRWYADNEDLTTDEVHALLTTRDANRRATINRAQTMAAMQAPPQPTNRQRIPEDVRMLVWRRDGGACGRCGSNIELQIDHIVPIAAGGSNDPINLQVLCGPCNRLKGASVV